ncbi:amidohydrolase family protein [Nocardia sp. CA-119907]|uniref:amidohydrolase family protein n=1 Tax=Nocardia sp. CA-119907 TaxID=3239973 RepID=UPI003D99B644
MRVRIIDADRVLTGTGELHSPGTVITTDDRIAWVGATEAQLSDWRGHRVERIRLRESTILPGLIDAHVHLAFGCAVHPRPAIQHDTRLAVAATIRRALRELAAAGITTVRDLGAPRYVDSDTLATTTPPTRVLKATIPLTIPGGHCYSLGGAVTTDSEIARLVAANAARGAEWIKVMVTGGFTVSGTSSPYEPQFSDHQLRVIVAAARDHGLPIAAHAHGITGIRQAVDVGVDSIEHCTWMTDDGGFDFDLGLVNAIATQQIMVCPTINHEAMTARGRLPWAVRREQLTVMLGAGVRLVPGTDSGIPRTPHNKYAHSLPTYLDLGLTPAEVIDLATRRAAQALRIDHSTGTLTAGLSADLIAVPGDPRQDLTVLATPILAITAGHLHYPAAVPTTEEYTRR